MSEKSQNLYTPQEDPEVAPPAYEAESSFNHSRSIPANTIAPASEEQPYSNSSSKKTIAIPAIDPYSSHSPFLRAFPPVLHQSHNLPRESFLPFLENLNKVIADSPPLEVLDITGGILQSVPILFPLHWIGSAVSELAQRGSSGVAKSRTDSMLKQANREIFGPRNLRIEIGRLDALAHIAQLPILGPSGRSIDSSAPVMQQLITIDAAVNQQSRDVQESARLEAVQQQLSILQPWIAELEVDALPCAAQSKLTRFNTSIKKYTIDSRRVPSSQNQDPGQLKPGEQGVRKGLWLIIREF